MIEGVKVEDLRVIPDDRGYLMEMFRSDSPDFEKFGQAYMTVAYPGVVKGWHYHKIQTDNIVCVSGMLKVALYDDRDGSPTKGETNTFIIGWQKQRRLSIPPGVYHGFIPKLAMTGRWKINEVPCLRWRRLHRFELHKTNIGTG
jgi:dTDP-4-dehydrorhamnose 3,5-epimerase